MIALILGTLLVVACLLWGAAWLVQIAVVVVVYGARFLFSAVSIFFGCIVFVGWFIVDHRSALAALRMDRIKRAADAPSSPHGERPFRRRPGA